jgi:hypothetical protein
MSVGRPCDRLSGTDIKPVPGATAEKQRRIAFSANGEACDFLKA